MYTTNLRAKRFIGNSSELPDPTALGLGVGSSFVDDVLGIEFCLSRDLRWVAIGGSSSIALYVNPAGSDANPGTQALPLRTIAEAMRRLPPSWKGGARIYLSAGAFPITDAQFALRGGLAAGPDAEILTLIGTFTDALGQRTVTASGGQTVTDNTLAMVANAYVKYRLRFTTGPAAGTYYLVRANTNNTFTLLADALLAIAPNNGDHFVVESIGSVINATTLLLDGEIAAIGVKFNCAGGMLLEDTAVFYAEICEAAGAALLVNNGTKVVAQGLQKVGPGAAAPVGVGSDQDYAGLVASCPVQITQGAQFYGALLQRGASLSVLDHSTALLSAFDISGGAILIARASEVSAGGAPSKIDLPGAYGIRVEDGSLLHLSGGETVTVQNSTGDAIELSMSKAVLDNLAGAGNTNYGVSILDGSKASIVQPGVRVTVTGANNLRVGTLGARTYAALAAAVAIPDLSAATRFDVAQAI